MKKYDLNKDFPDQKGWLEMCSPEEKKAFIFSGCCFDTETDEGKRVFTLRAASKCSLTELYTIQNYMNELNFGHIADIGGRYYVMDRDKNMDRVDVAYRMMVDHDGPSFDDYHEFFKQQYEYLPTILR